MPGKEVLEAWLALAPDWPVLTGADGRIAWARADFLERCGAAVGDDLAMLLDAPPDGPPLADATQTLHLRTADGTTLRVEARTTRLGDQLLWALRDVSAQTELAEHSRRLEEWLDVAREFGRLGLWERDLHSGKARWDAQVFRFWGLDPTSGTPSFPEAAMRIHPDDRLVGTFQDSIKQVGRYAQRFRVQRDDGSVCHIHSQWNVKAGPDGAPERVIGIMMDDTESHQLAGTLDAATLLLALTVDLGHIVHWRHDLSTGMMHYNPTGFDVMQLDSRQGGIPIEEIRDRTHPDDLQRVLASAQRAIDTGLPDDVEARYRRSDGTWRNMQTRRMVQRAADGRVIGFVGVSFDITDQVQRQRRAEQAARRFETAATAAGLGIWSRDPVTMQATWNRQLYVLTGRDEALGPPTLDEWLSQLVHPADRERMAGMEAWLRDAGDQIQRHEYRIVRPDGETRWMENRFRRETTEAGPMLVGVELDITERRRTEAALRSADERAALAARYAGIGTWEVEMDEALGSEVERWDEQMFLLRGLAPAAQPPSREQRLAMVHADDRPQLIDVNTHWLAGEESKSYEFRVLRADGSTRWLASRSIAIRGEQPRVLRRVGVNWDVTESKNAAIARQERALAERESEAKSQFLARMSHELRTPLNAVLGFAELLHAEARREGADARAGQLGHIRTAGGHLLSLINDVLELSELEARKLPLEARPVTLAALWAECLPLVEAMAVQGGVSLHADVGDATVHGDPRRLRQVLLNLLSNAIKYNRSGGHVWVTAQAGPSETLLSVRDDGRGLSPAQRAQLFQPFNRLGAELDGIEGSGIGLVIVKTLVESMGGGVQAHSAGAVGTVFEVRLPAGTPPRLPVAAHALALDAGGARNEPRPQGCVLYIEDNAVNVLLVEALLARHTALRLESEATGAAGVARAIDLQPDLLLIDMQLPDFDGFEVLRRLRATPATAALPCLALSANAMAEDIGRARAAGFAAYLTKPINVEAFLGAIRQHLPARGGEAQIT